MIEELNICDHRLEVAWRSAVVASVSVFINCIVNLNMLYTGATLLKLVFMKMTAKCFHINKLFSHNTYVYIIFKGVPAYVVGQFTKDVEFMIIMLYDITFVIILKMSHGNLIMKLKII